MTCILYVDGNAVHREYFMGTNKSEIWNQAAGWLARAYAFAHGEYRDDVGATFKSMQVKMYETDPEDQSAWMELPARKGPNVVV